MNHHDNVMDRDYNKKDEHYDEGRDLRMRNQHDWMSTTIRRADPKKEQDVQGLQYEGRAPQQIDDD
jgi:hypothetical protein